MTKTFGNLTLSAILALPLIGCTKEKPMYEATPQRLNSGSLLYATMGCGGCHGTNYTGLDSSRRNELGGAGLSLPDFTAMKDPQKTPVDYFRVITAGTSKTQATAYKHDFQSLTDAGRWDLANFLYSWAPRLRGSKAREQRSQALTKEMSDARDAYEKAAQQGKRRWELGYAASGSRPAAYSLAALVQKTGAATRSIGGGIVGAGRAERGHAVSRGRVLYRSKCAACHGAFGEGYGIRLGLAPCVNGKDQCDTRMQVSDLALSTSRFAAAHGNDSTLTPSFRALNDEDSALIFSYLRSVGK